MTMNTAVPPISVLQQILTVYNCLPLERTEKTMQSLIGDTAKLFIFRRKIYFPKECVYVLIQ